jgi:hypothetical protein
MASIEHFEINNYGDLKIRTYKEGRQVETSYSCVPKKVLIKFITAKSMPEVSEVDKWVKEAKEKRNNDNTIACCSEGACNWWSNDD